MEQKTIYHLHKPLNSFKHFKSKYIHQWQQSMSPEWKWRFPSLKSRWTNAIINMTLCALKVFYLILVVLDAVASCKILSNYFFHVVNSIMLSVYVYLLYFTPQQYLITVIYAVCRPLYLCFISLAVGCIILHVRVCTITYPMHIYMSQSIQQKNNIIHFEQQYMLRINVLRICILCESKKKLYNSVSKCIHGMGYFHTLLWEHRLSFDDCEKLWSQIDKRKALVHSWLTWYCVFFHFKWIHRFGESHLCSPSVMRVRAACAMLRRSIHSVTRCIIPGGKPVLPQDNISTLRLVAWVYSICRWRFMRGYCVQHLWSHTKK